ncbi:MAG TPA: hypothetical protein VF658_16325 [Pyrinomonadaceae bacterium]
MFNYMELKERGRKWLDDFSEIEFVGEIEVPEEEVSEVCASIGRFLHRAKWDDEHIRAALAVAVVNLAFYSPQDVGEEGFRWLALHKLLGHHAEDGNLWEREVGEPVLRLLKDHFHVEDIPGPYRYVRPVMQQVGVPAKLDRRFAQFVVRLLRLYGHNFSDTEYKACCIEFEGQLSTAEKFLNSAKGRQYCRDIARIVRNIEEGILTPQQINSLSFRLRTKVRAVLQALGDAPRAGVRIASLSPPRLILDRDNLRLVIEFSAQAFGGSYQWSDGVQIRVARYVLKEGDFAGRLHGTIIQPDGKKEPWEVKPWRPSPTIWAAFRESDGSFLEPADTLRPGRYILALPYPHSIPDEHVIEECGEMYLPGFNEVIVRVFDCELPTGFSLPELSLSVFGVASNRAPVLRFAETPTPLPHTANVFVRELPEITIENWDLGFADSYMLIWESGACRRVVPESLYSGKGILRLPVEAPSQGRVHIEPKGRTPRGFAETSLNYVLLPEAKVTWPRGLHEKSARVRISLEPAGMFAAEWQQSSVEHMAESTWEVPTWLDFVNGQVTYAGAVSFHIAGPVYRFDIKGESITDQVLWDESLKRRSRLHLSLSAAECGSSVELGLIDQKGFAKVIDLGPVPRSRLLIVSTDDVRDAFDYRGLPAGRIAVRAGGTCVVRSDVVFLHERRIIENLFDVDDNEFDGWCRLLPDDLQIAVKGVRGMLAGPVAPFAIPSSAPPTLRQSLSFYDICGRVIDSRKRVMAVEEITDTPLKETLTWYAGVCEFIDAGTSFNPREAARLLASRPRKSRAFRKATPNTPKAPTDRWRKSLAQVLRTLHRLKSPADYKRIVREWSICCRDERWHSAIHSLLASAPGGELLTRAAEDYRFGLEELGRGNMEKANDYLSSACVNVRKVMAQVREGLVLETASALEAMIFYHFGHEQFKIKAQETISLLGDHWNGLKKTLGVLCGAVWNGEVGSDSLGLSDFSPHERDVELEEHTGR